MPHNSTKLNPIYLIYMYKNDLALNNLHWLICHKIKPNQTKLKPKLLQNEQDETWSHFKRDKASLNSELSFFKTGSLSKVKVYPTIYPKPVEY